MPKKHLICFLDTDKVEKILTAQRHEAATFPVRTFKKSKGREKANQHLTNPTFLHSLNFAKIIFERRNSK